MSLIKSSYKLLFLIRKMPYREFLFKMNFFCQHLEQEPQKENVFTYVFLKTSKTFKTHYF